MAYLVTLRTYDNQGAAALDQSLLEAEGIAVHLLNYDSSLSDLCGQLRIRLQVLEQDVDKATLLLADAHPPHEGSAEVVRREAGVVRRAVVGFFALVLILWVLSALFFHVPGESPAKALRQGAGPAFLLSLPVSLLVRYLWRFIK